MLDYRRKSNLMGLELSLTFANSSLTMVKSLHRMIYTEQYRNISLGQMNVKHCLRTSIYGILVGLILDRLLIHLEAQLVTL